MELSQQQIDAIRVLRSLPPQERLRQMYALDQQDLYDAELAKDPIGGLQLPTEEWAKLRAHILDGGGTSDASRVVRSALTAVLDDDQVTFWRELIHALKAAGKQLGVIVVQDGQVGLNGVVPTNLPTPEPDVEPA